MSDVRGLFERRRPRRRFTTIGIFAVLLGAVLVAACAGGNDRGSRVPTEQRSGTPTTAPSDLYQVDTTVEQHGTDPPVLCLGPQLDSGGPVCGGVRIAGWSWDKVEHQTSNGITQGDYHLVGTFDGTTFTPTEPPAAAPARRPRKARSYQPSCRKPPAGWTDADPSRLTQNDFDAFMTTAKDQPDSAGLWIDASQDIYTVAFTGDLDRHRAQLRALWGGPICVVRHKHSTAELDATAKFLFGPAGRKLLGPSVNGVSPDPADDVVHLYVLAATPAIRRAVDRKYGGLVDVIGDLTPVSAPG